MNFPSASDSLNITSTHALQTPEKISNHTYYGRKGGKHSRTEMCAQKEWHGEFSTDLSGETSWPPVCIQLVTLWAVGFGSLTACFAWQLCSAWKAEKPAETYRDGNWKKEKKWQSNSHSTEKRYFKECTGMFHIMSQEDPVCTLMKLGFKFSFAVLIFTPASVPLQ